MKYSIIINGQVDESNVTFMEAIQSLQKQYPAYKDWRNIIPGEEVEIDNDIILID